MIQRPQTILLFIAAALYLLMNFFPIWSLSIDPSTVELNSIKLTLSAIVDNTTIIEKEESNIYLLAILTCGFVLSIITIFLFKNRTLQMKLTAANIFLMIIFMGLSIIISIPSGQKMIMSDENGTLGYSFYFSVGVILSLYVANRLIRKDEDLVKSVDRIR